MPLSIAYMFAGVAPEWRTSAWVGFLTGLLAAILISVLISRLQGMRGVMIKKHRGVWTGSGLKARVTTLEIEKGRANVEKGPGKVEGERRDEENEKANETGDETEPDEDEDLEDENLLMQEKNFVPSTDTEIVLITSRPALGPPTDMKAFECRRRLWHEPPELDYDKVYALTDAVQQEIKNIGGEGLEWRTNWLDLTVERNLLFDYQLWVQHQWRPKYRANDTEPLSENERRFYINLEQSLAFDAKQVVHDSWQNDGRYAKGFEDIAEVVGIVDEVKTRARGQQLAAKVLSLFRPIDLEHGAAM